MPRNLKSEIFVALITILGLGGAVVFGIFLSSQNPDDGNDPTEVVDNPTSQGFTTSNVDDDNATVTIEVTITTDVPATDIIETEIASDTPVATDVDNAVSETEITTQEVATDADPVSVTSDEDATPTERIASTESPTNTPRPSRTFTLTATVTPSATDIPTQTFTPTVTFTPSDTPTPTRTPRPMEQDNILPTPTADEIEVTDDVENADGSATPVAEPNDDVNSYGCTSPVGWSNYVVQVGNTLFSIARAVNSTVSELRDANCLPNANQIIVGDVLFVPQLPNSPVQTNVPSNPSVTNPNIDTVGGLYALGCTSPAVQITAPSIGQHVQGVIIVSGVATYDTAFGYYRLEIRPDQAVTFSFYSRSETPVVGGVLGQIDTGLFSSGLHWLRLTVVDNTGNIRADATCVIPIIID